MRVGADGRDMDERAGAGRLGRLGDIACPFVLHGLEGLLAGGEQDADQIDHRVGVLGRGQQGIRKPHIGLHRYDLPDAAERLEMPCEFWPPDGDPHARAGPRDSAHHMPPKEAGAPIDGHERSVVECNGHLDAS